MINEYLEIKLREMSEGELRDVEQFVRGLRRRKLDAMREGASVLDAEPMDRVELQ